MTIKIFYKTTLKHFEVFKVFIETGSLGEALQRISVFLVSTRI